VQLSHSSGPSGSISGHDSESAKEHVSAKKKPPTINEIEFSTQNN